MKRIEFHIHQLVNASHLLLKGAEQVFRKLTLAILTVYYIHFFLHNFFLTVLYGRCDTFELLPDAHLSLRAFLPSWVFLFYTGHSWDLSVNWSFSWLIVLRVGLGEWIKHTLLNLIGLNENKKYNVSKYVGMTQKQCSEGCFQQWMLILEMRKSLKLITQVSTSRV